MKEANTISQIPERQQDENLLEYTVRISKIWANLIGLKQRKLKAQFFTPKEVSLFMAKMFTLTKNNIRLLDAGAGVGNLSAAFCYRLLNLPINYNVTIDAYENDPELISVLENTLKTCKRFMNNYGHTLKYRILEQDFVIHNQNFLNPKAKLEIPKSNFYDYAISNPPFYKLEKSSPQAQIMRKILSGHPNIYALFMLLSTQMLRNNGQLVFITPRSFCSGVYFKNFRKWFLKNSQINHLHIFESRKDIFGVDQVLQENILIKATKSKAPPVSIKVSSSKSKLFDNYTEMVLPPEIVLFKKNSELYIRIPSSQRDVSTLKLIDSFPSVIKDFNLEISTGPVVVFRTKHTIQSYSFSKGEQNAVPLLWAHNFDKMTIDWTRKKNNKPSGIYVNKETKKLLVNVRNMVLLKRFSSKEQIKRLNAVVLLKEIFPFDLVGLENHLNFIYKLDGEMSKEEAVGLASLLNSRLVDNYFRSLNGNTQVNAVDIRSLPLPDILHITEIGRRISEGNANQESIDNTVFEVLKIDNELVSMYQKRG